MKISTPVAGFTGRTYLGPLTLDFHDGHAELDGDLPDGARDYLLASGYGIDGPAAEPAATVEEPADPRDVGLEQVGSPLRDAAVDPAPEDFLAPTNAGQANPHGSTVVSPGIHALDSLPVAPGPVPDDAGEQDAKETSLASAVLVEQQDVGDATKAAAGETSSEEQPKGNASRDDWATYALAHGASDDDIADLSRDQLREQYGNRAAS